MGGGISKKRRYLCKREFMFLKERVKILQEEMKQMVYEREKESMSYERDMMLFTFKEADWKQERKRLREEVRHLRMVLQEKEDQIREFKELGNDFDNSNNNNHKELELMGTKLLVQKMKEERVWRDEAVEKWKQLYLAIKTELDDLIQRTYGGDGLLWKAEEDEIQIENLKRELQEKDEAMEALKAQLASMEYEKNRTEREFDMLRQSLRIMNGSSMISIPVKEKLFKSKYGR